MAERRSCALDAPKRACRGQPDADDDFPQREVFVFCSETHGLAPALRASFLPAQRIRLPMRPDNRSLNLSNTVAVVSFETWRQHSYAVGP